MSESDALSHILDMIQGNGRIREALRVFEDVVRVEEAALARCDQSVQELFQDNEFLTSVGSLREIIPYLRQYEGMDPNDFDYFRFVGAPLDQVRMHLQRITKRLLQMGVYVEEIDHAEIDVRAALLAIEVLKGTYDRWRIDKSAQLAERLRSLLIELVK